MTTATKTKARRLLHEGRVAPRGAASIYQVVGDHDTYQVTVGEELSACTCPAYGTCSHLTAARLLHHALQRADAQPPELGAGKHDLLQTLAKDAT